MTKRWNSANKYAQQCHIVLLLNMAYLTAGEADINLGTVNLKAAHTLTAMDIGIT
jgi:hypothetical protein